MDIYGNIITLQYKPINDNYADAGVFRQLKALCDQSGMTIELAANVIVTRNQRAHESAVGYSSCLDLKFVKRTFRFASFLC